MILWRDRFPHSRVQLDEGYIKVCRKVYIGLPKGLLIKPCDGNSKYI
jgi:hypothetical protein